MSPLATVATTGVNVAVVGRVKGRAALRLRPGVDTILNGCDACRMIQKPRRSSHGWSGSTRFGYGSRRRRRAVGGWGGQLKPPDYRGLIKQATDLWDRVPPEATARRADLQHTIDLRIDALVAATHQGRALREAAASYQGNWRDVVLFVCTVLFTVVWWNVNHHRTNWLAIFIVLILLSIVTAVYAARGLARAVASLIRAQRRDRHNTQPHALQR